MKSAAAIRAAGREQDLESCPQCGSTSRVGRGHCLNCLLYRGLGEETYETETLESVLDEVDVRDADWRLGNYQILEEIGRGGMGVIYRARQRHSRRIVALKRILSHHADSHDTLVRFRREAEAAASLDHQNILPIYEVSEGEDGLPFFSMKFAAGGSLLENETALRTDWRKAVGLMAKVTRAVEYAHSKGILHRDLKPGNVLLDGCGEPLVSDFGLAKWLDASSDLTRTLTIFGTPGYIAPEQAHGPASGLRPTADIYSLGAILFGLLTGRPPFLGEHALSVIEQAREKPAPKLRSLIPKADRDLETICARCLERDPTARYQSAAQVFTDLERWLERRPIIARPVAPATRIWRWAKRNPKLALSVCGCVLSGFVIATFAILSLRPIGSVLRPFPVVLEKSIAVLPFQNLSDEKQNTYFTDGVQDEILNGLAKVADLKVISRASVRHYGTDRPRDLREIARALGVAHVVEGSVQRIGDRVRVSAQLVDARSDAQVWGEHYDRQIADIFAIESELAEQIVSKLKAKLSPQERVAIEEQPTRDLSAYDLYLRARNRIDAYAYSATGKEDLLEAGRLLETAISRDPNFLAAYYHLARVHTTLYFFGIDHTKERLELANSVIQTMMRLKPGAAETHLATAQYLYASDRDYDKGLKEIAAARKELPNEPFAFVLAAQIERRTGQWEKSVRNLEQALELDPRNVFILQLLSSNYVTLHRFKELATTLDRIIAVNPKQITARLQRPWVDLLWRADSRPLHSAIEAALAENPDVAPTISSDWMYLALWERDNSALERALAVLPADGCRDAAIPFPRAWCEGLAARSAGDLVAARTAFARARAEAEEVLKKQPDYAEELCVLGMIDAALGKKQDAIREGRRATEIVSITKDAMTGTKLNEYLAIIYAWAGERNAAVDEVTKLAHAPSNISYGDLRLDPYWDPLRGDSRFEKLVASLAPKP